MQTKQELVNRYLAERIKGLELVVAGLEETIKKAYEEMASLKKKTEESRLSFSLNTHQLPMQNGSLSKVWLKSREMDVVHERWGIYKKLYQSGMTINAIARHFNVSRDSVGYARRSGWISKHNKRLKNGCRIS